MCFQPWMQLGDFEQGGELVCVYYNRTLLFMMDRLYYQGHVPRRGEQPCRPR